MTVGLLCLGAEEAHTTAYLKGKKLTSRPNMMGRTSLVFSLIVAALLSGIAAQRTACKTGDIVFLLDRSSSINQDKHNIMKNFTTTLVDSFEVGEKLVHIGLCQFSDEPNDEFYLNKYYNKEDLNTQILNVDYKGGNSYLGRALDHVKKYFEKSQGSRDQVPKILVVITDGDSDDDVEDAADILRDQNITVFAIGVGDVHDLQLLQTVGIPERMFAVRNYDVLHSLKQRVVDAMCGDPNPPPPPPLTDTP
ncbi:hypothetical protein PFLUV_G00091240 [Perca fluviatilis]|uniref:VWFA domain-containing protein n=1 Tax=Perca fluviatilis TaxID=8168 RepID=A0A6A5FIS6_PERFL|nr:collagen alpha-6(VI) chain-like [Perca fluviatilis]KAF1388532.1 hypothetical protein PFLUV_G00091240 [Perca fluviatilis]